MKFLFLSVVGLNVTMPIVLPASSFEFHVYLTAYWIVMSYSIVNSAVVQDGLCALTPRSDQTNTYVALKWYSASMTCMTFASGSLCWRYKSRMAGNIGSQSRPSFISAIKGACSLILFPDILKVKVASRWVFEVVRLPVLEFLRSRVVLWYTDGSCDGKDSSGIVNISELTWAAFRGIFIKLSGIRISFPDNPNVVANVGKADGIGGPEVSFATSWVQMSVKRAPLQRIDVPSRIKHLQVRL